MNRTFALLLASAVLLAHMLALHEAPSDAFAPPYEIAHVAFRLARNYVQYGEFAWDPGRAGVESYPSLLWIALAVVPERLQLSVTTFSQVLSAGFALLTTLVLARFSPGRLAGVIAPLLFVASGAVAAAAASGTEMTLAALLVTSAFLAYERGARRALAVLLSLACLTRPEGLPLTVVLLAVDLFRGRLQRRAGPPPPPVRTAFIAPAAVALAVCATRFAISDHFLSPWAKELTHPGRLPLREAAGYLREFFTTSAAGMLIVFPLWYLARGTLTGRGARALVLTLAWCAISTLGGGGPEVLPFSQFMVPILAVLLVAVQEAMTVALDSKRRGLPQLTWALFLVGLGVSALASKFPGDLGPLKVESLHRAWMTSHAPVPFGHPRQIGREALTEEIQSTSRLRGIGAFLRDHLDPRHSVLTPWPGAVGYLSGLRVVDALSRATPQPGVLRARAWNSVGPWDLVAVLQQRPEYLIPTLSRSRRAPSTTSIAREWIQGLDLDPSAPERRAQILRLLSEYELITVPAHPAGGPQPRPGDRYYLMRLRQLELRPQLAIDVAGDEVVLSVSHRAHDQLVDLRVQLEDARGELWSLRPTGEFRQRPDLTARRSVLLFRTGTRRVELVRVRIPQELDARLLRAVLLNPGAEGEPSADVASAEVVLQLR